MKFMLLHYVDETVESDEQENREGMTQLASWLDDTIGHGVNLHGSILQPSRSATTVRTRDDEILVTDGPFAETKEQVAGYDVIECADLQEAGYLSAGPGPRRPAPRTGRCPVSCGSIVSRPLAGT